MYQLIVFDWDGTLMDSARKITNCIRAAAREVGFSEPAFDDAKTIIGLGLTEAMQRLFPQASGAQVAALVESYRYHFVTGDTTAQELFDGVVDGLQALENRGALLAVATGKSRAGLERAFAATGLHPFFVTTRCADETRSKPHPQMLHEILEFTAIEPHRAIMIGDTTFDMEMAANANMPGLGVSYGVHTERMLRSANALGVLHSFSEMTDWLLSDRIERAYV